MSQAVQRTRRRQQRLETRAQILAAAQEFLRERSYRELTADAVMSRTGHTRTVFYRHFDDIPSLVLTLMAELGAELVALAEEWADTDRASAQEARVRLAGLVDFHVRHGPVVQAVAEAAHHDDTVEQAYAAGVERFVQLTAGAIEARIATGELQPLDAPETARALVLMLNEYLGHTFGRRPYGDRDRALDVVWTIWTRTLFPGAAGPEAGA